MSRVRQCFLEEGEKDKKEKMEDGEEIEHEVMIRSQGNAILELNQNKV